MSRSRRTLAASLLAAVLVVVAGCGSDSTGDDSSSSPPTTTAGTGTDATTAPTTEGSSVDSASTADTGAPADAPDRIISLYPTATEMLWAIGAGDQVIAVDDQSNFPEAALAKQTDLSGFTPNVEAIASYDPDLVLVDGTVPDLEGQLEELGIDVWVGPAAQDFDDIYVQIEELGAITGHPDEAASVVSTMQAEIDAAIASVPPLDQPPSFYHELDSTLFSITSNTFIGDVYRLFGLVNIADSAEGTTDYPQLSAEFVISQNPDLIFLADAAFGESPESVAARDGWDAVSAVATGSVIPLDGDISSRWGPRIVDYVEVVAAAVADVARLSAG